MTGTPGLLTTRLLVRDLAQIASPGSSGAPLRGAELKDVRVIEDGFVLMRDGAIEAVGRMRDLRPLDGEVEEIDGRGQSAIPGLVDCHTHPAWGGDRVEEFSLRAAGAGYEELHAAGGGILATVRATRALGEDDLNARVARHAGWMLRDGTTTWEGKSGYGLDRETELASLGAVRAAGGSPTWLGAHAVPPEFDGPDAYLDFALEEVLPAAAKVANAADVFLERGAFDATQARRYLTACRDAGLALRLHGDQFTESGAVPLAVELGARSVDHLEATGVEGARLLAGQHSHRCLAAGERALPRSADAARPCARRRRRGDRACERLQPGELVHDQPAARLLARVHAAEALARRGACRGDRERCARPRLRVRARPDRIGTPGGHRPARRSGLALPRYHLAGDLIATVIVGGRVAHRR